MNAPMPDDDQPMREALQRDAARVPEPPFDSALHHATMRRIRALETRESTKPWFVSWPALAGAAAVLAATIIVLWIPRASPHGAAPVVATAASAIPSAPASLLSYQAAAREGEAALFAALDRDAAELLPASSPVFNTALR